MAWLGKKKYYRGCHFSADVVRESIDLFSKMVKDSHKSETKFSTLSIYEEDITTKYDNIDEFISDYRSKRASSSFLINGGNQYFIFTNSMDSTGQFTSVDLEVTDRSIVNKIFEIFDRSQAHSKIPTPENRRPVIFIGHGRSALWRDLKDHLHDKHQFQISAYETGARSGHTIRDILDDMIRESSFAILVMTGEDEQADGALRCRQNVVHEAGLFQGRLGFPRAIVLIEKGTERFSNIDGVQYIEFSQGNIKETFGDILAALRREFGSLA